MKLTPTNIFWLFCILSCSGKEKPEATRSVDPSKEVVCFVYHRFGDDRFPSTNISLKDFEAHLTYLKENAYQVLSFSDAITYLHSDAPVKKTAVITIDDGYKSFYNHALPLLTKYQMPATLFINTETVGGNDYMNWDELREAAKNNVEIGNHSHSHPYFLNEPEAARYDLFRKELETSQALIKQHLDITCTTFAYPYGELDEKMKALVQQLGFKSAAAQNSGVIYNGTDVYQCPRFPMSEAYAAITKFTEKIKTRPLRVANESPTHFSLSGDRKPALQLTFARGDLQLNQLQCFIQGGDCTKRITHNGDSTVTVTIQATQPITGRRRTLYTVTVPDNKGTWYWHSHLWIDPAVKP